MSSTHSIFNLINWPSLGGRVPLKLFLGKLQNNESKVCQWIGIVEPVWLKDNTLDVKYIYKHYNHFQTSKALKENRI